VERERTVRATSVASVAWIVAVGAALVLLILIVVLRSPLVSGDSVALVQGTHNIVTCMQDGVWTNCNSHLGSNSIGVTQFPLMQFVPSLVLERVGLADDAILHGLSIINVFAFVALVACVGYVGYRTGRRWVAPALVLVVIVSPLIVYTWYTFGEATAALLVTAPVAAALLRSRPAVLGLLVLLAGLSKETTVFLVVPACALAIWATPLNRRPLRTAHWIALAVGGALSIAVDGLFNVFRYGHFVNDLYTQSYLRTPGIDLPVKFFVSLWAAPNAGSAFYWPTATAILLIPIGVLVARLVRAPRAVGALVVPAAVLALVGAQVAFVAKWASPFGWVAWGPRLLLPALPMLALVAIVLLLDAADRVFSWIGTHVVARVFLFVGLVVFLVPQIGVLFKPSAIGNFFAVDPTNGRCPRVPYISDGTFYYHCLLDLAWRRPSPLVDAAGAVTHGLGAIYLLVFIVSTAALVHATGFVGTRREEDVRLIRSSGRGRRSLASP
jgi:hypothetical protein